MTPADLLAELARLAVVVEASDDGRPMLDGVFAEELMTAARAHRWLFTWGLRGARSGHSWFVCDACSELQLLSRERLRLEAGLQRTDASCSCSGLHTVRRDWVGARGLDGEPT